MKINVRNASLIVAITVAFSLIFNPYFNHPGENLVLAAVIGFLIYLVGVLTYYATGQLALMCEARPAIDKIIVYDGIEPVGEDNDVLYYNEHLDCFQFIYTHPLTGLNVVNIFDVDKDEIEVNSDLKPGISITETRYTWASPIWQFFAQCPKVAAWAIFINDEIEYDVVKE